MSKPKILVPYMMNIWVRLPAWSMEHRYPPGVKPFHTVRLLPFDSIVYCHRAPPSVPSSGFPPGMPSARPPAAEAPAGSPGSTAHAAHSAGSRTGWLNETALSPVWTSHAQTGGRRCPGGCRAVWGGGGVNVAVMLSATRIMCTTRNHKRQASEKK